MPEAAAILARRRGEPPSPAAARARRARWRRRNGLVPRTIDVDENGLAEALIASGRLTEAEALRPELIDRQYQMAGVIQKAGPAADRISGPSAFDDLVRQIMATEKKPRIVAMQLARKRDPEAFAKYRSA